MLSRNAILQAMEEGAIVIDPPSKNIGVNSVDLTLGETMRRYDMEAAGGIIDPRSPPPAVEIPMSVLDDGTKGWIALPGELYLGCTAEETYCVGYVPILEGRSTCGRLGVQIHLTAGVGDNGFRGFWTLEIKVTYPTILRPGDRLAQVFFHPCFSNAEGTDLEVEDLYSKNPRSHYSKMNAARAAEPLD